MVLKLTVSIWKGEIKMDDIDIKLISLLASDASVTASSLVAQLNLSVPAINKRIAKLKADGIIRRTTILTDPEKIGKAVTVYILLSLERFNQSTRFFEIVEQDQDILECYAISGGYDYLLKICTDSVNSLEDKILKLKQNGIAKSNSIFALREYKFSPTVLPK